MIVCCGGPARSDLSPAVLVSFILTGLLSISNVCTLFVMNLVQYDMMDTTFVIKRDDDLSDGSAQQQQCTKLPFGRSLPGTEYESDDVFLFTLKTRMFYRMFYLYLSAAVVSTG